MDVWTTTQVTIKGARRRLEEAKSWVAAFFIK